MSHLIDLFSAPPYNPGMTTPRRSSFESTKQHPLQVLDSGRLSPWTAAIVDYLKAVSLTDWFSSDAENREGRLFFAIKDDTSDNKITVARAAMDDFLKNNTEFRTYLLESYETVIKNALPGWQKTLQYFKKAEWKKLKNHKELAINDIHYFHAGRNIVESFWQPLEESYEWNFFWENNFSHQFSKTQAAALKELIRGALAYYLLLTWQNSIETASPQHEEHRELISVILIPLLTLLTKTFNDSAIFLLNLFDQSIANKKNEPLLVQRIILTTEFDEAASKLIHKNEDLPFIEKLKILIGGMKSPAIHSMNDNASTALLVNSPGRSRASSVPAPNAFRLANPGLLSQSPLFRQRNAVNPVETKGSEEPETRGPDPFR